MWFGAQGEEFPSDPQPPRSHPDTTLSEIQLITLYAWYFLRTLLGTHMELVGLNKHDSLGVILKQSYFDHLFQI